MAHPPRLLVVLQWRFSWVSAHSKSKEGEFIIVTEYDATRAVFGYCFSRGQTLLHKACLDIVLAAELEEANQKEGPEVTEAESIVADVDKLFQTTES
ncbi:hypothetical protein Tco_0751482 [Tanacetum coccineum]|uniref:Uncharacterized protein n=1 Tax=Tanacetum coccineum TaxID=301880 RepID=A0ABQ4Z5R6_9ASTR